MAEIKNSFLKSKMNKDLDDRILTNGAYRDANNISVGRSEDSDVGALENIVGNLLVTNTDLAIANLEVIGSFSDDGTNQIFIFLTDYTGTAFSPANKNHLKGITDMDDINEISIYDAISIGCYFYAYRVLLAAIISSSSSRIVCVKFRKLMVVVTLTAHKPLG